MHLCTKGSFQNGVHLKDLTVLQIKRGKRDNLGIIFHIDPLKHMLRPIIEPSLTETVLMRGHDIIMFSLKNMKNYI